MGEGRVDGYEGGRRRIEEQERDGGAGSDKAVESIEATGPGG